MAILATDPAIFAESDARLADAAEAMDRARLRALIKEKIDVNCPQVDGTTALHWATYQDDQESARLLVKAGADVNVNNRYGVMPLSLACTNGSAKMVELLLDAGADANSSLHGGETVLMTASRTGRVGPVKALIEHGAKLDAKERRGQTALMWAAADGHAKVVDLLIEAGADFRTQLASGFTPMFFAVREGRVNVVRILLRAGVDVNEALLSRKSPRKGPVNGTSALILAVENGHFELAVLLLEAGANPDDQRSGYAALHMITWVRKPNRGDGADGDPAPQGSGNLSSLQFVEKLVSYGADVNARLERGKSGRGRISRKGATPFLMAAITADAALMRTLAKLGADPLISNSEESTPLMAAAGVGTVSPGEDAGTESEVLEAVQLALELGGDINAVDNNGETAMHGAAYKSLPKVVEFLVKKGAKIEIWNRKNRWSWTPLSIAQGYRVGNFKPSPETVAAIHEAMLAAGVSPPEVKPPTGGEYKK